MVVVEKVDLLILVKAATKPLQIIYLINLPKEN